MRLSSDDLSYSIGAESRGITSQMGDDTSRTAPSSIMLQNQQDMKRFDVLKYYDEHLSGGKTNSTLTTSLFTGGLDTGMEIGKFIIDTTNNINSTSSSNFLSDSNQSTSE